MIAHGRLILFQLFYFILITYLNTNYTNIPIPTSEEALCIISVLKLPAHQNCIYNHLGSVA